MKIKKLKCFIINTECVPTICTVCGLSLLGWAIVLIIALGIFTMFCIFYPILDPCALYINQVNLYNNNFNTCISSGYLKVNSLLCTGSSFTDGCFPTQDYYLCYQTNNGLVRNLTMPDYGDSILANYSHSITSYPTNRTINSNVKYDLSCKNCQETFLVMFDRSELYNKYKNICIS